MVIIQAPQNLENYIKVGGKLNTKLQEAGYQPLYKDNEGFYYYLKTKEVKSFVRFRRFLG